MYVSSAVTEAKLDSNTMAVPTVTFNLNIINGQSDWFLNVLHLLLLASSSNRLWASSWQLAAQVIHEM